jgi:hypothetical protein
MNRGMVMAGTRDTGGRGTRDDAVPLPARWAEDAFGYPLTLPRKTLYEDLAVDPDASSDEVRWAKGEAARRLQAEKNTLDAALESVYTAIPGLKEAYAEHESLTRSGETGKEVASIARRLADLERQAQARDAGFKGKRERSSELTAKIHLLNRTSLDKPDERLAYDIAHPPLALLKLADGALDGFLKGKTLLFLLRREISRFLAARGEAVFHPSDLTREDFTADFTPNLLLDGPTHD